MTASTSSPKFDNTNAVMTLPTNSGAGAYAHLKDVMGRLRTQSLFFEMKNPKYPAPFTLKDYDHKGSISMYRKYMAQADPTEYSTAIALLGSWRHWQALVNCEWFKPYITRWRDELRVKFENDRYLEMKDVAEDPSLKGTSQSLAATKWLAARYCPTSSAKRGRPSADEKKTALQEETEEDKLIAEEGDRIAM